MPDFGLTHIALVVSDMPATISFYERYAAMQVVHSRPQSKSPEKRVVWMSDKTRPFVIVFLQEDAVEAALTPLAHLGFACRTVEELDRKVEMARVENVLIDGPHDSGPPVGKWAFLRDPNGHTLELSFGQEVRLAITEHESPA